MVDISIQRFYNGHLNDLTLTLLVSLDNSEARPFRLLRIIWKKIWDPTAIIMHLTSLPPEDPIHITERVTPHHQTNSESYRNRNIIFYLKLQ